MDWFRQNKIAVGSAASAILITIKQSGLVTAPLGLLLLDVASILTGMIVGSGMNIKSDKQEKIESIIGDVPKRRILD